MAAWTTHGVKVNWTVIHIPSRIEFGQLPGKSLRKKIRTAMSPLPGPVRA